MSKEKDRLSISECKKILSSGGNNYTDEEIIKMRNWLYKFTEITLNCMKKLSDEQIIELKKLLLKNK